MSFRTSLDKQSFVASEQDVIQALHDLEGLGRLLVCIECKFALSNKRFVHVDHTPLHTNIGLVLYAAGSEFDVFATG